MQRDGGPGAGGNPTGGSFTGPAETLELLGNHIYGFSGNVTTPSSQGVTSDLLNFTTGNYYTVATLQPYYDNLDQGDNVKFSIEVGGIEIYSIQLSGSTTANVHRGDVQPIPIIVPSYTNITVTAANVTDNDPRIVGIVLVGRIYRG